MLHGQVRKMEKLGRAVAELNSELLEQKSENSRLQSHVDHLKVVFAKLDGTRDGLESRLKVLKVLHEFVLLLMFTLLLTTFHRNVTAN